MQDKYLLHCTMAPSFPLSSVLGSPFEVSVNLAFGKQSVGPKAGCVWDIDPPLTSTVHVHSSHVHLLCLPRAPVLWEQPWAGSGLIFSHL